MNLSTDPELGTIYSVAVPVKRVKKRGMPAELVAEGVRALGKARLVVWQGLEGKGSWGAVCGGRGQRRGVAWPWPIGRGTGKRLLHGIAGSAQFFSYRGCILTRPALSTCGQSHAVGSKRPDQRPQRPVPLWCMSGEGPSATAEQAPAPRTDTCLLFFGEANVYM